MYKNKRKGKQVTDFLLSYHDIIFLLIIYNYLYKWQNK